MNWVFRLACYLGLHDWQKVGFTRVCRNCRRYQAIHLDARGRRVWADSEPPM